MPNNKRKIEQEGRLISLQVLRAVAAIMVATAHLYSIDQRFFGGPMLSSFALFGFAGVDLFFVLSGFVMVHLTRFGAGHASIIPSFLFARAARIYPLWWLTLGVISAVWLVRPAWVFASISGAPNLLTDFVLWPHERLPLLAVGWTLIHEMYFYFSFGILLLLPARYLPRGLIGWMLLVSVGNFLLNTLNLPIPPLMTIITHPLTLEFGIGAIVGLLVAKGVRPTPLLLVGAGLAWLAATALLNTDSPLTLFENNWSRMIAIGPAWGLIIWGMIGIEVDRGQVPFRALAKLGDSSYALYLIHVPVFAAGARIISPFCGADIWDNVLACLALLAAATFVAIFLHHFIERPILKKMTRLRWKLMPNGSALMPSPPPPLDLKIGPHLDQINFTIAQIGKQIKYLIANKKIE